jgi:hypothetical protein
MSLQSIGIVGKCQLMVRITSSAVIPPGPLKKRLTMTEGYTIYSDNEAITAVYYGKK